MKRGTFSSLIKFLEIEIAAPLYNEVKEYPLPHKCLKIVIFDHHGAIKNKIFSLKIRKEIFPYIKTMKHLTQAIFIPYYL